MNSHAATSSGSKDRRATALNIGLPFIVFALAGTFLNSRAQERESNFQSPSKTTANAISDSQQLLHAAAINTLISVAAGAKKWDDRVAAVNVETEAADLLWASDPDVARSYLITAWETTALIEEPGQERSQFRNESVRIQSRRTVLLVARKYAPSLAAKWLNEMVDDAKQDKKKEARGVFDDRSARSTVLLQMARAIVADNPQAAAELAAESLADGISFGLQDVLVGIQERDFELAQRVVRAAYARLQSIGMADPNELLILYAYLYTPGKVFSASTSSTPGSGQVAVGRNQTHIAAAAQLNPALALEFLGLAADLLMNAPPPSTSVTPELTARSQISVINIIIGKLHEHLPQKAAGLQLKAQQIAQDAKYASMPETGRPDVLEPRSEETKRDYGQRRIDLLEEAAEKAPDQLSRDIAYGRAALATDVDSYQRGWKLAGKIYDDDLRRNVTNWINYRAALNLIKNRELAKAYELSGKNSDLYQRAAILVVGAQQLIETKQQTTAREWLDEARTLIKKSNEPDDSATRIALGITSTYARVDTSIAGDTLSEAIRFVNRSPKSVNGDDRAPLVRRFTGFGLLPNFTYGTRGFSLEAALNALPPDQFENTFYRLHEISSPEARGAAIVTLCRKYLLGVSSERKKA